MFGNYTGSTDGVAGKANELNNGYNILLQIKEKRRSASPGFFRRLIENIESRLIDIMSIAFPSNGRVANREDQLWLFAHRKEIETALPIFKELRSEYKIPWDPEQENAFNQMLKNLSIEKIYTSEYEDGGKLAKMVAYWIGVPTSLTTAGVGLRFGGPPLATAALLIGCTSTLIGGAYAKKQGGKVAAQVAENAIRNHFGLAPI